MRLASQGFSRLSRRRRLTQRCAAAAFAAGLACDPDTGEVIPCTPGFRRAPSHVFT
jgi:hypothetical protein